MIQVTNVAFAADHVAIQFIDLPGDVRDQGRAVVTRMIELHMSHPDYREAAEKIQHRLVTLVEDGLENWFDSSPHEPTAPEDDEDDKGMGE